MNKSPLSLLLFLSISLHAIAQTDSAKLTSIVAKLEKISTTHPVEKVYLHFNKPAYETGDTIWFKGYLMIGPNHQPSGLSGVIHVELINSKDKVIKSLMLKNNNGVFTGDVPIDTNMHNGSYRIRAYTNWMRNVAPDYFFNKTINITDTKSNTVFITSEVNSSGNNADGLINAQLHYADKFGRPFDHKKVIYDVKTGDDNTIYTSTGLTDQNGKVSFAFAGSLAGGQKRLSVVNHIELVNGVIIDKIVSLSLLKDGIDLQFFPEGGQLVNSVRSKIAFKALGTNGLGIDVKGSIIDNDNKEVAFFESQHAGMGIFALMPQSGKSYRAKVMLANKLYVTVALPMATDRGFVLAVNSSDSLNLVVRVATNAATLQEKQNTSFYLVAQVGGTAYYTTTTRLSDLLFAATIPKSKFPTGIAQFTLFDSNNQPVNERVAFVNNGAGLLKLGLKTNKSQFTTKEKVMLSFDAKDNMNKPTEGSFSLTVFSEDKLIADENNENTILSNILLTSDLKGYIEEPNYYFNQLTNDSQANLDILMLTQGYRRFAWTDILADKLPEIKFKPEKSLSISGTLTNASGKPVVNGQLKVLALSAKTVLDTVTDANGRFVLNKVEFADSTKIVIQARKANDGRNVNITLDNNYSIPVILKNDIGEIAKADAPPYLSMRKKGIADTTLIASDLKESKTNDLKSNPLKEVKITGKKEIVPDKYNSYGTAYTYNLKMDQVKDYNSVYEAVAHLVPGVHTGANHSISYENKSISLAVINGLEYKIDYIEILDPKDIKSISVTGSSVLVTTKEFAGTDTLKVKTSNIAMQQSSNEKKGLANTTLKQVDVKARKNGAASPWAAIVARSANLNGPGHANQILTGKDLENCVDIITCIISKIPFITRANGADGSTNYYFARRTVQSLTMNQPIQFMLDGTFVTIDYLSGLNAVDISAVEVLSNNSYLSIYGSQASGGLIIVTTKLFNAPSNEALAYKSVPGVIYTKFNGFYQAREFYKPKYTVTNVATIDSRTAIYWNPNIITDSKGLISIEFYNSDIKGNYRAVIEGVDNEGNIGRYVYRYKVE